MIRRIVWFVYQYGLCAVVRKVARRSYVPTKITWLYFWRLGGMSPKRVAKFVEALHCKKVEIILSHGLGGGADMYLDGHIRRVTASGCVVFLLKPDSRFSDVIGVDVFCNETKDSFLVRSVLDFKVLCGMDCEITVNELAYWHWYDESRIVSVSSLMRLVDVIVQLKEHLNAKMTYLVHDYYCLCPRFDLMAPNGTYCASERTMAKCAECMNSYEWTHLQFEKGIDVVQWRSCFGRFFLECNEVRTFSEDTKARIIACFPAVSPTVVPHTLTRKMDRKPKIRQDRIMIGVFGHVQPIKGARIVVELARYLERLGRSDVKIKIVGDICGVPQPLPKTIEVLGKYQVEDLPAIIEREGINVGFMSSICPETFSYVTHELMAMGLPVVCFDIGAPHDAVAKYEKGMVADEISAKAAWRAIARIYYEEHKL